LADALGRFQLNPAGKRETAGRLAGTGLEGDAAGLEARPGSKRSKNCIPEFSLWLMEIIRHLISLKRTFVLF